MLELIVSEKEFFDEKKQEFIKVPEQKLVLEHSLLSIAKWESKWEVPFLEKDTDVSGERFRDYIRCMTLNQIKDPFIYYMLSDGDILLIYNYINAKMTATWFNKTFPKNKTGKRSSEKVTSELIYYWMIAYQIPFSCEKWHINRLLTLIEICSIKEGGSKKMPAREVMKQNALLNEARRKKLNSRG